MDRNMLKIFLLLSLVAACIHTSQERSPKKSKPASAVSPARCNFAALNPQFRYFHIVAADQGKLDPNNTLVIGNEAADFFDTQTNSKELSLDEGGCLEVGEPWVKIHIMDQEKHQGRNLTLKNFAAGTVHSIRLEPFPAEQEGAQYVACGKLKDMALVMPGMIFDLFDAEGKELAGNELAAVLINGEGSHRLTVSEGGCLLLPAKDQGTIVYSDQKSFVLEFIYRGPNPSGDPFLRMLGSPAKKTVKEFISLHHKG